VEDWNRETIFYRHYRSILNHCDIISLKSVEFREKKRKIRAITTFKVIQSHRGRYQSKARMRLPISDSEDGEDELPCVIGEIAVRIQ